MVTLPPVSWWLEDPKFNSGLVHYLSCLCVLQLLDRIATCYSMRWKVSVCLWGEPNPRILLLAFDLEIWNPLGCMQVSFPSSSCDYVLILTGFKCISKVFVDDQLTSSIYSHYRWCLFNICNWPWYLLPSAQEEWSPLSAEYCCNTIFPSWKDSWLATMWFQERSSIHGCTTQKYTNDNQVLEGIVWKDEKMALQEQGDWVPLGISHNVWNALFMNCFFCRIRGWAARCTAPAWMLVIRRFSLSNEVCKI